MDRIAIVGGHGQVARHLLVELRRTEHTPLALVRKEAYRDEHEHRGAQVGLLDIEQQDAADFAAAFEGCAAVVFAAGGGPDGNVTRKRTVDLEGSLKSIEGARLAGIERFVQISAIGVEDPLPANTDDVWRAYVEAKRDADAALRESGLAWTILRPGRLTDDPATGRVPRLLGAARRGHPSRCRRCRRHGARRARHCRSSVGAGQRRRTGARRGACGCGCGLTMPIVTKRQERPVRDCRLVTIGSPRLSAYSSASPE
jgi:nucleoside-diphosphate-sugar epimerase